MIGKVPSGTQGMITQTKVPDGEQSNTGATNRDELRTATKGRQSARPHGARGSKMPNKPNYRSQLDF